MRQKLKKLIHNNKGSGLVTVLVMVTLITALGGSMLLLCHSVYQIRSVDREGKQNYYAAETAMNRVCIALQNAATVAIREAYADVLADYSSTANTSRQTEFARAFVDRLGKYTPQKIIPGGSSVNIFNDITNPAGGSYDLAPLDLFAAGSSITLESTGDVELKGNAADGWKSVTLKAVKLTCVSGGFSAGLSTDIVISVPEFSYVVPEFVLNVVYDYITVVTGALKLEGIATINGDAYFGAIDLDTGRNLTLNNGTIICDGEVKLGDTAVLNSLSSMWARRFLLGAGADIKLHGDDTYVADDLRLNGDGAKASLKGRYYGFGTGGAGGSEPENSSSIIVNGKGVELDLTGLTNMMLAGYTFLQDDGSNLNLGSSMTVKSDQTVFLAPESLLKDTAGNPYTLGNPAIIPTGARPDITLDVGAALPQIPGKKLSDYGGVTPLVLCRPLPSNNDYMTVYVFLQFADAEDANGYFRDYLANNNARMQGYYGMYLANYSADTDLQNILQSAGTIYAPAAVPGNYALIDPQSSMTIDMLADRFSGMYENLRRNLATTGANTTLDYSPFSILVSAARLYSLPEYDGTSDTIQRFVIQYSSDGESEEIKTAAVMLNNFGGNEFELDDGFKSSYPDTAVVIASGDVRVSEDFNGLILCNGSLTLESGVSLSAESTKVSDAFLNAVTEDEGTGETIPLSLTYFMRNSSDGDVTADETIVKWDLDTVVTYNGWNGNPED